MLRTGCHTRFMSTSSAVKDRSSSSSFFHCRRRCRHMEESHCRSTKPYLHTARLAGREATVWIAGFLCPSGCYNFREERSNKFVAVWQQCISVSGSVEADSLKFRLSFLELLGTSPLPPTKKQWAVPGSDQAFTLKGPVCKICLNLIYLFFY